MICVLGMCLAALVAQAQDDALLRAARYLSGAGADEDLSEEWVERLEALWGRKIRVNSARVRSNGLLTDYQEASLADYRAHNGDILSWEELALVDGFSRDAVEALRPFLSLDSDRKPGATDTLRLRATALVRTTLTTVGAKAKVTGEHWRAGGAWRGKDWTVFGEAQYGANRWLVGDYNIRLGQGLSHWSGFSLSSLSTVDAFIRRSPGLSPVWSYSSASVHRGLAYEYTSRHFRGLFFADKDMVLGLHADWLARHGQLGLSIIPDLSFLPGLLGKSSVLPDLLGNLTVSLDGRLHLRRLLLAGEVGWKNRSWAALGAMQLRIGEHHRLALQARGIPSRFSQKKYGEYALAVGYDLQSEARRQLAGVQGFGSSVPVHGLSFTCDAALLPLPGEEQRRLQVLSYAQWNWQASARWSVVLRVTERYRNYEDPRTDIRADVHFGDGPWQGTLRGEWVHCGQSSVLTYLEGGYKGENLAAYLRLTGFLADNWNARIYCYERDAPGTFSVPAYYGRGLSASLVGSWKYRFRWFTVKTYVRASYMVRKERKPTPALNFQLQLER